ncbi:MAG: hypothetical protein MUC47_04095 [Candidatus Kapabacteria bacterium]|nr:hypothetical protein [Candidatus Kapabacteria bacterium]
MARYVVMVGENRTRYFRLLAAFGENWSASIQLDNTSSDITVSSTAALS